MVHFVNGTLLLYGGLAHGDCLADTWARSLRAGTSSDALCY